MKTNETQLTTKAQAAVGTARLSISSEFSTLRAGQPKLLELALNEAEALAWQTPFPHLIFPSLAEEKVKALVQWSARQSCMLRHGAELALCE